ncbi:tripartite motif-containing protein 16-like protein [Poecilia latipinna]|uniref:tripartite motif-containing protein 16-like protein n=1 Tax=Poecilia latipinna TaxID=48699 RepID=UPI00072EDED2|nr:PREDICTED: tripartite motif-containing protein 16-like protein [Poecilia latipinna]
MAQRGVCLEEFSCSICLDLLKNPVTIPCGHSFCKNCIKNYWDEDSQRRIHTCPQCRKMFRFRPVLVKNIMLAALMDNLKKTRLQAAPADHCYAGPEDVACDVCTGRKMKAVKSCLSCLAPPLKNHKLVNPSKSRQQIQQRIQDQEKDVKLLQQEVEAINVSADKAVEDSEKIFTELIRLLQKRSSEVKQQIRSQQETEVSRVKDVQEKLEQEITELKRKDAELEQLSHTEDHNQFLLNYPSLSALSESTHSSSINIRPLRHFEDVTAAVSELRDKLQDVLRDTWTNISPKLTEVEGSLTEPEPKTRTEFLKYSQEITLDRNTANRFLLLSKGNRKVTRVEEQRFYPDHPDRFAGCCQVLSRESLTGRCYWEMEWSGGGVEVVVSNKNIGRAGSSNECEFGFNGKSWSLNCTTDSYTFYHNLVKTPVPGPVSSRIGVYLDHRAGILCFYSVSGTTTLLHRVQTRFTQPLHAGVGLFSLFSYNGGATAEFVNVK